MRIRILDLLRCPHTGRRLHLTGAIENGGSVQCGWLVSEDGTCRYPIRDSVPRFVPESNYAGNFGME